MGNNIPQPEEKFFEEKESYFLQEQKKDGLKCKIERQGLSKISKKTIDELKKTSDPVISLSLNYNRFGKLDILSEFQLDLPLIEFSCHKNFLKSLPENFSSLYPKVKKIDAAFNRITSIDKSFNPKLEELTHLDLNHNSIAFMSKVLCSHTNLEHLDLSANVVGEIPDEIKNLQNLKVLNLTKCQIHTINESLGKLKKLEKLSLSFCDLLSFDINLSEMKALKYLDLSGNKLSYFPECILELENLEYLDLSSTAIAKIPNEINKLKKLKTLRLNSVPLTSLPETLADLQLEKLFIRWTNLKGEFPPVILQIPSLNTLDMTNTTLKQLPSEFNSNNLPNLKNIYMAYNMFKSIPKQIKNLKQPIERIWLDDNPLNKNDQKIIDLGMKGLIKYLNMDKTIKQENENKNKNKNKNKNENENEKENEIIEEIILEDEEEKYLIMGELDELVLHEFGQLDVCELLKIPENATTFSNEELKDRIRGLVIGNCIGDAVGLATEFLTKPQSARIYDYEIIKYDEIIEDGHRSRWEKGDWTDDSDQMIHIILSLIEKNGSIDKVNFAKRLCHWIHNGFLELTDHAGMGLGGTVARSLSSEKVFENPHIGALQAYNELKPRSAANGAIMRTSALGIPQFYDLKLVTKNTLEICKVTHYDPRCQASCVCFTTTIAQILQGKTNYEEIMNKSYEIAESYCETTEYLEEFKKHLFAKSWRELDLDENGKIGYTYKAMGSGYLALQRCENTSDFEQIMTEMTFEAGDADTNGTTVGALMGVKLGYSKLPKRWKEMPHTQWVLQKLEALFKIMGI
ncbi:hypothetical protein M0813_25862 [Anaeramoeba flamelloides]|uniref:ADP-ribosylglycohydrolase n=1 Tax=Anaeramoeba flamelloides TaxID=1746091 RepID=A0ABQ8Y384_9EUKA|nr:hypothetical protein M0813_25862 [Anaeramoeba flamelloides]